MRARALRARVAACLRAERGDTLIEVLIAALLVALIAAPSLTGYGAVSAPRRHQRHRVAGRLARPAGPGAAARPDDHPALRRARQPGGRRPVDRRHDLHVTSKSQFVSGASAVGVVHARPARRAPPTRSQTTSTVTWAPSNDGRPPVIVHGLVTPGEGGSLIVIAPSDQTGNRPGRA